MSPQPHNFHYYLIILVSERQYLIVILILYFPYWPNILDHWFNEAMVKKIPIPVDVIIPWQYP